jgi:hypothetical protein
MVTKPNAQQLNQFAYDAKSLRYRHVESGKFVSAKTARAAVDTVIDTETQRIRAISQQLVDGEINLAEWQIQTSTLLKHLHVAMGLAASGGVNGADASTLGFIGSQIKEQYKFLRKFARDIKSGKQKLDRSLVARSALYTQSARGTHEKVRVRSAVQNGLTEERNILGASDHCHGASNGCIEQQKRGWVPIGQLVPVGERLCMANCRCSTQIR